MRKLKLKKTCVERNIYETFPTFERCPGNETKAHKNFHQTLMCFAETVLICSKETEL